MPKAMEKDLKAKAKKKFGSTTSERARKYIPDIAITTDLMVGFPGETEDNFKNSLELIKRIKPLRVHIFPYSKRPNTPACKLGGFVSSARIKSRQAILERLSRDLRTAYCRRFIGRDSQVLLESQVSSRPDIWEGYTDNYIRVRVESKLKLKNQIIQVSLSRVVNDFVLGSLKLRR